MSDPLEEARAVLDRKSRSYVRASERLANALLEVLAERDRWRARALELEATLNRVDPGRAIAGE